MVVVGFPARLRRPGDRGSKKARKPGGVARGEVRIGRDLSLRKGHETKQKRKEKKGKKKRHEVRKEENRAKTG